MENEETKEKRSYLDKLSYKIAEKIVYRKHKPEIKKPKEFNNELTVLSLLLEKQKQFAQD